MKRWTAFGLFAVTVVLLLAPQTIAAEKKWKNETELSYVQTDGNTEVTTLSFKNQFDFQFNERLKNVWKLGALYSENEMERTAENYMTELRMDFKLKEKIYAYGLGGYVSDEFAGFDHRYYGGLGMGYVFLDGPGHFLSSELGINYTAEEYIDDTESEFMEGRAYLLYEYAFNEKSRFSQGVEYLYDFEKNENYRVNSDTALKVQINTLLALKVGFEVRYDNDPTPITLDDADTRLYTALVVSL